MQIATRGAESADGADGPQVARVLHDFRKLAHAAGAARMDRGPNEDDTAARGLYESCGLTKPESGLYCDREL